jgi:hypothetical protein
MNNTRSRLILFFLIFSLTGTCFCQLPVTVNIEGRILDATTSEPLPFVSIQIKSTQKGTISDGSGYFSIVLSSLSDTLVCTSVGYQVTLLLPKPGKKYYEVKMSENTQLLNEIVITSKEIDLYQLIQACAKKNQPQRLYAKSYYQLKSFVNGRQIELVESYFNAGISGYDLESLSLKSGRIALQVFDHQFFISTESSAAITRLSLINNNAGFPGSPLEMPVSRMKKAYKLELAKVYMDDNAQEIYQVDFTPVMEDATLFSGKLWINHHKKQVVKVQLFAPGTRVHPFKPLFPSDTIRRIDLDITKTFSEIGGRMYFNHVDFNYNVYYKSRNDSAYVVNTKAILYAYAPGESFLLPKFEFTDINHTDYRKINAMPYNVFFWEYLDEFRLIDRKDQNRRFYEDDATMTNKTMFGANPFTDKGLLEHPYVPWDSSGRITIREFIPDSTGLKTSDAPFTTDLYNLSVKTFLDVNPSGDSLHWMSATIFDPYETFYHLPVDDTVLCFINLYFDIMEVQRRFLEKALSSGTQTIEQFNKIYNEFVEERLVVSRQFLKEVNRGINQSAMLQWNAYVRQHLGIDNIRIFRPYPVLHNE